MLFEICETLIQVLSILLITDRLRLAAAHKLMLWNKPLARRHMAHYLRGQGEALNVDTAELLDADRGVRATLLRAVAGELNTGQTGGRCVVSQLAFADNDWRCALGGLTLDWQRNDDGAVAVSFIDRYHWSPADKRISAPLHRAAERSKARGAAEFEVVGTTAVLPPQVVAQADPGSQPVQYRRFYI